jgi:hypothetical protein
MITRRFAILLAAVLIGAGCKVHTDLTWDDDSRAGGLVGAWRSHVQFESGAFASVKDLEFLYVFNTSTASGQAIGANDWGTMTESSNYDGAPPVPPAYGIWRRVGPREFEAKYLFYSTKPPGKFEEITSGGGWMPAGHGELVEHITLSPDGQSFTSTIQYDAFDVNNNPIEGGGPATGNAKRIGW